MDIIEGEKVETQEINNPISDMEFEQSFLKAKKSLIRNIICSFICLLTDLGMILWIATILFDGGNLLETTSSGEYAPGTEYVVVGAAFITLFGWLGGIVLLGLLAIIVIPAGIYIIPAVIAIILACKKKKSASIVNWIAIVCYIIASAIFCCAIGWASIVCIIISVFNIVACVFNIISTVKYRKVFNKNDIIK